MASEHFLSFIKKAQKLEKSRFEFYSEYHQLGLSQGSEEIIEYLIDEKKGHLNFLLEAEAIFSKGGISEDEPAPEFIRNDIVINKVNKSDYDDDSENAVKEIKFLEKALEFEEKDNEIYKSLREECDDDYGKDLFEGIINAGSSHIDTIKEKISRLKDAFNLD